MNKQDKDQSVCFTGHRPSSMPWGYNQDHKDCKQLKKRLKEVLTTLIGNGFSTFYNGLAEGFDMLAAEILLELKSEGYPVYMIGCIPCGNQDKYFSDESKAMYQKLKENCDELYFVTEGHYFRGCTHVRNKYMVDNSTFLVAYCHKDTGGAASTLAYAKKQGKEIIEL